MCPRIPPGGLYTAPNVPYNVFDVISASAGGHYADVEVWTVQPERAPGQLEQLTVTDHNHPANHSTGMNFDGTVADGYMNYVEPYDHIRDVDLDLSAVRGPLLPDVPLSQQVISWSAWQDGQRIGHGDLTPGSTSGEIQFQLISGDAYDILASTGNGTSTVMHVQPADDFIAIADRLVSDTGVWKLWHYSVEYWRSSTPFPADRLNHQEGYTEAEIRRICPDARKEKGVEVLADSGWSAWAGYTSRDTGTRTWKRMDGVIDVAYVRYEDDATRIMPIYDAGPNAVKEKWDRIIKAAKEYLFAEQGIPGRFRHWPGSLYIAGGTNSNTFARYVVESAGLGWTKMTGLHPGRDDPSLNIMRDLGGRYTFYAALTPTKGPLGAQPPGDPP